LERGEERWYITHTGRNPLIVRRPSEAVTLQPGQTARLDSGNAILLGRVSLRFFAS
jgi:hypothetical protein